MAKLILNDIGSFSQTAITTINQNHAATEAAMENTLSRDGTAPNQMTADFDMNGNDILNVEKATIQTLSSGSSDVDVQDIIDNLQDVIDVEAAVIAAEQAAADAEAALVQIDAIYDDLQPLRDGIDGGTTGQFLTKNSNVDYDYLWQSPAGSGNMLKSVYDPTNINASAFARANHTGTQLANTISNFSTSVQTEITTTLGPSTSPQFAAVNIGHATDTTFTRLSAGVAAIESRQIAVASDVTAAAPSANSFNNYAPGIAATLLSSILNLAPTVCTVITGLDTTGWVSGKRITLRNTTSRTGADSRIIILPRNSSSSSAANRFQYSSRRLPLILMPGEFAEFLFDGTDLKLLSSSRPLARDGYFDEFRGSSGSFFTNGGLIGNNTSGQFDTLGDPYAFQRCQTGPNANGGLAMQDGGSAIRIGSGAIMALGRVNIPVLSNAINEFSVSVGFAHQGVVVDGIYWCYERATSTNWIFRTNNNGTATSQAVSGFAVDVTKVPMLGVFVNGDGTRSEAFYSNDEGASWVVHSTAITANLPAPATGTFGNSAGIMKSAGGTSCDLRVVFIGQVGW